MKQKLFFLIVLLSAVSILGQAQNPNWVLKSKYLHFATAAPHSPTMNNLPAGITQTYSYANSYSDASGNVLFYIVDGNIYSSTGTLLDSFWNGNYSVLSWRPLGEIVVVPDPGNCKRYYITYFVGDSWYNVMDMFYSIVDVSTTPFHLVADANGYTATYITCSLDHGWWTLAGSKLRSDNSRFIFAWGGRGDGLYRYTISMSGFNLTPTILHANTGNIVWGACSNSDSELELSEAGAEGGYYVGGTSLDYQHGTYVWFLKLDANGNYINNSWLYHSTLAGLTNHYIHGLEFSPSGQYLYYTHETDASLPNPVEYLDVLNGGTNYSLIASVMGSDLGYAEAEYGLDGAIYFAVNTRMAKLTNPNTPSGTNFYNNANLGSPGGTYILPDQVDGDNYYVNAGSHLTGAFALSYGCSNCNMYITVTSTEVQSSIQSQIWYLYRNAKLMGHSPVGSNPATWTFSPILLQGNYMVRHVVTDFCNVQTTYDVYVYTDMPPIDPTFNLSHGPIDNVNQCYNLTATCNLPPCASFTWKVEDLTVPGNVMDNSNPLWWVNPNSCIFQGYCCNNSGTQAGVFYLNHTYRITHGTWSNCNPWASSVMTYGIFPGSSGDYRVVISNSSDGTNVLAGTVDTRATDFEVFPNPASDYLTISSGGTEGMTYTIMNMVGKVLIPATPVNGSMVKLDVSTFSPGLYLISNNQGVTKKFIIQK